jgi:hypothetical protein
VQHPGFERDTALAVVQRRAQACRCSANHAAIKEVELRARARAP